MEPLRVWLVGHGTVGRWLTRALHEQADRLTRWCDRRIVVVGIATAHAGFVFDENGLDLASVLELDAAGGTIADLRGVARWPTALEGLRATEADVLVEVSQSPPADGSPGAAHIREALRRRLSVVTSNKWPVALHGVEFAELARASGISFRAESTVMSGTPVLSTLTEGMAGAVPLRIRGLLNATVNAILTDMAAGSSYDVALARAQETGLAERDPTADVNGDDTVAKLMVLAALVFGRQLQRDQVTCLGIAEVTGADMAAAVANGSRIKHVATLSFAEPDGIHATVRPEALPTTDPLARVDGPTNAIVCQARPLGEVTIIGPGAGPELAGQGVLSDLLAVARR